MKRLTTSDFIEKAKAVHGDRYDYSDTEYVNRRTNVTVTCPEHGPFEQNAGNHLSGAGCPECVGLKKLTTETFIKKASALHGHRYDYSQVEYKNSTTPVTIICPDHGPFLQRPSDHLTQSRRVGCPECGGRKPLDTDSFIKKATALHGNRYDYSEVDYTNSKTPVTIVCQKHGPFRQAPANHLHGAGCPVCGGKKQLTTDDFVEKANAVHGGRYDYSEVHYVNTQTKVTITCPEHGSFSQTPNDHLSGYGCPVCGGTKRLTTAAFVQNANAVHGSRYDYSQVKYVNNKEPVTIICPTHGSFEQAPGNHLNGVGCPACAGNIPLTTDVFIEKAIEVHGNRYDYSQVEVVGNKVPVTIICPIHGPFVQIPNSHLSGRGCFGCGRGVPTLEEFVESAREIHGDRYNYSKVRYTNSKAPVEIICPDHGAFAQTLAHHLNGSGCPECAQSGFNPNDRAVLYYIAVDAHEKGTRYKIGITNRSVEHRFLNQDLQNIRIVKTWQYAVGRDAAKREAEILRLYAGDRYSGPDLLVSGGNTELFTHDILGLDQ